VRRGTRTVVGLRQCARRGLALECTTPTRVAISLAVNPITASLVGAVLLGEPVSLNLVAGIVTVFADIRIATTAPGRGRPASRAAMAQRGN
jgi:threonine/homoserine efflux transporter RhtA